MDLDWLWEQIIRNYRLDLAFLFHKLRSRQKKYVIVVTAMESGEALYLRDEEKLVCCQVASSLEEKDRGK